MDNALFIINDFFVLFDCYNPDREKINWLYWVVNLLAGVLHLDIITKKFFYFLLITIENNLPSALSKHQIGANLLTI